MKALRAALVAAVALVFVADNAGAFGIADVSIHDFSFDPSTFTVAAQGANVTWENNQAGVFHTTTSDIGLWDSSPNHPSDDLQFSESFQFAFAAAGTFPYHCKVHPSMTGQIVVRLVLDPAGHKHVPFTVTWASGTIPGGFNLDVQMNAPPRPGHHRHWVAKFANQRGSAVSGTVTPGRRGVYKFRAQLQNDATSGVGGFSPVATISVSPT